MAVDNANKNRQRSLVSYAISTAIISLFSTSVAHAALSAPSVAASGAAAGGADSTESYVIKYLEELAKLPENKELKALLDSANTDEKMAKLAGELTPDRSGASIYNVIAAQEQFTQAIRKRTSDFLLGDAARTSFWMTYLGSDNTSYITSEGTNRYDGYDSTSHGAAMGYDFVLSDSIVAGVAFTQQEIDSTNRLYDKSLEIESYQAAAYATTAWRDFYLNSRGVIGFSANTAKRQIGDSQDYAGHTDASARYNTTNFALEFDLLRPFYWNDFTIVPLASASYTHVRVEDYAENYVRDAEDVKKSAGSPAAMAYEQQNYQELNLGLGLELAHSFYNKLGAFQSRVGMRADVEVLDMDLTTTARLVTGGNSFTVGVNERDSARYQSYADLTWETNGSMTWSLGIQHDWTDTTENNLLYGRAVYSF